MNPAHGAPRVLALVPTWKAAGFLEPTLEALSAQDCPDFGVLVSDDASPDDSAGISRRHAARDPRFRVIRQDRNRGWVGNVNALLGEAAATRAELLLFAFQDDLPAKGYVRRCVAALDRDPAAVMAFSDIRLVHADGTTEEKRYERLDGITDRRERAHRIARQEGSWWIPNRGVFRAGVARAIGGLRRHAAGEFSADWPWLLEMSLHGAFTRVPEPLVTKIYRPDSLSRGWDFGARSWAAVTASAMHAVSRSDLAALEKCRLDATLAGFALGRFRRATRGALARALGRRGGARDAARDAAVDPVGRAEG